MFKPWGLHIMRVTKSSIAAVVSVSVSDFVTHTSELVF